MRNYPLLFSKVSLFAFHFRISKIISIRPLILFKKILMNSPISNFLSEICTWTSALLDFSTNQIPSKNLWKSTSIGDSTLLLTKYVQAILCWILHRKNKSGLFAISILIIRARNYEIDFFNDSESESKLKFRALLPHSLDFRSLWLKIMHFQKYGEGHIDVILEWLTKKYPKGGRLKDVRPGQFCSTRVMGVAFREVDPSKIFVNSLQQGYVRSLMGNMLPPCDYLLEMGVWRGVQTQSVNHALP